MRHWMHEITNWMGWSRVYNWAGAAAGVVVGVLGGWDAMMQTLLVLMVIDYITGVMLAIINKELSSAVGFVGLGKKCAILLMVALGYQLDALTGQSVVRTMVIMFYCANEGVSVLENASKLGLPVPGKLVEILEQLKGEDETPPK